MFIIAERRMFAKTIIDSDAFLTMPLSSQALYFHLSMRGDDEGFVNKPKAIMRTIGSNDDDIKILISKGFIIPFDSGIVVIKHWKMHNYIRGDRIKETVYLEEKMMLTEKDNNSYTLNNIKKETKLLTYKDSSLPSNDRQMSDKCRHRLGKVRLGKDNKKIFVENSIEFQLSLKLNELIHKNNPTAKQPDLQKWAKETDFMIRIDKRTPDQIIKLIEYSQKDTFWRGNILSISKLRKQFDQLYIKGNLGKMEQELQSPDLIHDNNTREYGGGIIDYGKA